MEKIYDVNSLYPFVMLKDMPLNIETKHKDMSNIKLEDFFGFCEAEITSPSAADNIINPLIPYKFNDKTIFPKGIFKGSYFSEELKAAVSYGYCVKLISGYSFTRAKLFNDYINYFYDIKKNSTGSTKFIAKLHLNTLYGYFGRKQDLLTSKVILNSKFKEYLLKNVIKSFIKINDKYSVILITKYINPDVNDMLKTIIKTNNLAPSYVAIASVKSNVAIASAVTAYARIHMMKYKNSEDCYYTDTDSVFLGSKLPDKFIGDELGQMKDELDGKVIDQAYFLGIKKYAYKCGDVEKSVIAGVTRNSISFKECEDLFKGVTLTKTNDNRFYKSLTKLNIIIKSSTTSIRMLNDKTLVNNKYIPLIMKLNSNNNNNNSLVFKILNRIKKIINRLIPLAQAINKNH
jgi:hypothetical protein